MKMMKNAVRTIAMAATLAATFSTTAAAQVGEPEARRSKTAGFHLGVFLNGSAVQVEESSETESGGGGALHLGYGVTPNVSLFIRANAANIDTGVGDSYVLAHADLGVRYSFASQASTFRPFIQGAVGGRAASMELSGQGTLETRGPSLSAGGGVEIFFTPEVAMELGLSYSVGKFSEGRLDGGEWVDFEDEAFEATSARFDIGVSYHP
jgi:hypothetical protein